MDIKKLSPRLTFFVLLLIIFINCTLAYLFYTAYLELPKDTVVKFEKPIKYVEYIEYSSDSTDSHDADSPDTDSSSTESFSSRYKNRYSSSSKENIYSKIWRIPMHENNPLNFNQNPNELNQILNNILFPSRSTKMIFKLTQ